MGYIIWFAHLCVENVVFLPHFAEEFVCRTPPKTTVFWDRYSISNIFEHLVHF